MDRPLNAILIEAGFRTEAEQLAARGALEAAGLTRPGKVAMHESKLERAAEVLADRLVFACPSCLAQLQEVRGDATVLPVADDRCDGCGGSAHRVSAQRFLAACHRHDVHRVAVVGGTPVTRQSLIPLLPGIELELVDGTGNMNAQRARSIIERNELVLVWGKTQLDHRVSNHFTDPGDKWKVIVAAKRGIAGLLDAGVRLLRKRLKAFGPVIKVSSPSTTLAGTSPLDQRPGWGM